jgi:hypothetical protein
MERDRKQNTCLKPQNVNLKAFIAKIFRRVVCTPEMRSGWVKWSAKAGDPLSTYPLLSVGFIP